MQAQNMIKLIKISAPARIHVTLFDMSEHGYRQNGGIGFCIDGFDTVIKFIRSEDFEIIDNRSSGLSEKEKKSLLEFIAILYKDNNFIEKMSLEFISGPPPHSGFGTGTASKLACVEAACIFNKKESTHDDIISYSGRGGTSGVGINTYFNGGLSIDFGVRNSGLPLGPSSSRKNPSAKPLQLLSLKLPEDWSVGVILLSDAHKISAEEEISFFNKTCPIPMQSVHESIYHAVSGFACAALEVDYACFCESINAIQKTEWKKGEWAAQSSSAQQLKKDLCSAGVKFIGLSSIGPAIYFCGQNIEETLEKIKLPENYIFVKCAPNNHGREIEID
jgi:beta-ribofuranosylaminobenzene 5'-phosphate synthase